jgi:hypothetical protein
MTSAFVYQTRYDASQEGDHDLLPLDNTASERPDWFEYWTMRTLLRTQPLNENVFYGFLSPRFKSKTNLSGREVDSSVSPLGYSAASAGLRTLVLLHTQDTQLVCSCTHD